MNCEKFCGHQDRITQIKLYKNNIYATKKFSFGTWTSRQHIFLRLTAGAHSGYGENIIVVNDPGISLEPWARALAPLKGMTLSDAFFHLRAQIGVWDDRLAELCEMTLCDLIGKAAGIPALELLELPGRAPVWGVYVILSDDAAFVEQRARWAAENGRDRFIKVKLFGEPDLDAAVIEAVRRQAGRECYLIGDVNGGYRKHGESVSVARIAESLRRLHACGLDACEDPAYFGNEEWVELQTQVGDLALIPDYPLRPSREAVRTILPQMGRIYNIHPGCTGSIIDAVALAGRVRELGARLMIGDDSLVGPGCTIWQQLAIGLGADWVEATEKPEESDPFLGTVIRQATRADGPIALDEAPGFGLELDEGKLTAAAAEAVEL